MPLRSGKNYEMNNNSDNAGNQSDPDLDSDPLNQNRAQQAPHAQPGLEEQQDPHDHGQQQGQIPVQLSPQALDQQQLFALLQQQQLRFEQHSMRQQQQYEELQEQYAHLNMVVLQEKQQQQKQAQGDVPQQLVEALTNLTTQQAVATHQQSKQRVSQLKHMPDQSPYKLQLELEKRMGEYYKETAKDGTSADCNLGLITPVGKEQIYAAAFSQYFPQGTKWEEMRDTTLATLIATIQTKLPTFNGRSFADNDVASITHNNIQPADVDTKIVGPLEKAIRQYSGTATFTELVNKDVYNAVWRKLSPHLQAALDTGDGDPDRATGTKHYAISRIITVSRTIVTELRDVSLVTRKYIESVFSTTQRPTTTNSHRDRSDRSDSGAKGRDGGNHKGTGQGTKETPPDAVLKDKTALKRWHELTNLNLRNSCFNCGRTNHNTRNCKTRDPTTEQKAAGDRLKSQWNELQRMRTTAIAEPLPSEKKTE